MVTLSTDQSFWRKREPGPSNGEEAANAKALINFLMQDRFFLALYRSNDPKERATAMDKLNKAHHQAYGDTPTKDEALSELCVGFCRNRRASWVF